jgi:hypothetical protein
MGKLLDEIDACPRQFNFDPVRQSNFDPGIKPGADAPGCG